MAVILPTGKQSFENGAGQPLVGGKVYTYAAGTNTPQATFADAAGAVPNANPVILDARGEATIFWAGAYKVVLRDAVDNIIWSVDNVATADPLVAGLAAASGSSKIGFAQPATGAIARTVQDELREQVKVSQFGAIGDGTYHSLAERFATLAAAQVVYPHATALTDGIDWAATQAAVNYCSTFGEWPDLMVTQRLYLDRSVIINRLVDTNYSYFHIGGQGPGAGFYTSGNVLMFETTIVGGNPEYYPTSEKVFFTNLVFRADSASRSTCTVLSSRFLRIRVVGCDFKWCRFRYTTILYSQTIHLFQNEIHDCGVFWTTLGAYDTKICDGVMGATSTIFQSLATSRGTCQLSIRENVIEVVTGPVAIVTGASGVKVSGNYLEYNDPNSFDFRGDVRNGNALFDGNFIQTAKGPLARYANTAEVTSIANFWAPVTLGTPMHSGIPGQVDNLVSINQAGDLTVSDGDSYRINGVVRAGRIDDLWGSFQNRLTKSDDARFGFGLLYQPLTRVSIGAQSADGTSTILGCYNGNGIGRLMLRDDGQLTVTASDGSPRVFSPQAVAIAAPAVGGTTDANARAAINAIRATLTAAGITL